MILEKCRYKSIFFSIIVLYLIFNYDIFALKKKIGFGGLIVEICSIVTFFLYYLLPLNNLNSYLCNNIIIKLTNYTQGIYCFHLILFHTLKNKINSIKNGCFSGIILLYIFIYCNQKYKISLFVCLNNYYINIIYKIYRSISIF